MIDLPIVDDFIFMTEHKMIEQIKIHEQGCLPSAFATAIGLRVDTFLRQMGTIKKDRKETGWDIQEIITAMFPTYGITEITQVETVISQSVMSHPKGQLLTALTAPGEEDSSFQLRCHKSMDLCSGVFLCESSLPNWQHAYAWNHKARCVFDPATCLWYHLTMWPKINVFWGITKSERNEYVQTTTEENKND